MAISAKRLVLDLLATAPDEGLPARAFIEVGGLFGLSSNNIRVALARLKACDVLHSLGRGAYRIGPAGEALRKEWGLWRSRGDMVRPWSGAWIGVSVGPRGRRQERAAALLGLRPLSDGLSIRPDNLGDLDAVAARLVGLGVPEVAPVFRIDALRPADELQARGLWASDGLAARYRKGSARLAESAGRLDRLSLADAAREAFLVGGAAIKDVLFDPLLPAPLAPVDARERFFAAALDYERQGRGVWDRLVEHALGAAA